MHDSLNGKEKKIVRYEGRNERKKEGRNKDGKEGRQAWRKEGNMW